MGNYVAGLQAATGRAPPVDRHDLQADSPKLLRLGRTQRDNLHAQHLGAAQVGVFREPYLRRSTMATAQVAHRHGLARGPRLHDALEASAILSPAACDLDNDVIGT